MSKHEPSPSKGLQKLQASLSKESSERTTDPAKASTGGPQDLRKELLFILSAGNYGQNMTQEQSDKWVEREFGGKADMILKHFSTLLTQIEAEGPKDKDYMTRKHETKWGPQSCGIWNEANAEWRKALASIKKELGINHE
jgi:hypothetical protein